MAKNSVAQTVETPPVNDKMKALQTAMLGIEKEFGKGAAMFLGEKTHMKVEHISSGCLSLDRALGIGGYPKGRIIEMYGPESSGKTTLALHAVAQAQKEGGLAAFIDVEHALDPVYAAAIGVDINTLIVAQPDTGEQALEIAQRLIESGGLEIIVIDSVAALVPKAEIEGDMGDSHMGLQARLMSQALRKMTGIIGKTNTICIFINQLRSKIGVMYGNPETTTGGNALKYYASVRVDIRKIEALKNGTEMIGTRTRAKIVKNKVAPPFRQAEFDIMYGEGISYVGDVIDTAIMLNIIEKGGAWFTLPGGGRCQGKDKVKALLKTDTAMLDNIVKLINDYYDKDESNLLVPKQEEEEETVSKTNDIDIIMED